MYEKQKYGLMALVMKETNELIGFCGFIHQTVDEVEYIERKARAIPPSSEAGQASGFSIITMDCINKIEMILPLRL